jgi:hypothetical protein
MVLTASAIVIYGAVVLVIAYPSAYASLADVALGREIGGGGHHGTSISLMWLASCIASAFAIFYRDPSLLRRSQSTSTSTSSNVGRDDETHMPNVDTTPRPIYAPSLPTNAQSGGGGSDNNPNAGYNVFDPADLPPRLSEYANMVYTACEDLGNFFGFQDSSVRNQAEHLLVLLSNNRRYMNSHILPPALQPPSPIHALHAKVFSNYMKWCRYQGVPPHFSRVYPSQSGMAAPPSVSSRVVDLVLFFCVWGEACNIRHMPECMWFLYHKMMEEYSLMMMANMMSSNDSNGLLLGGNNSMVQQPRSLYAGHFLDFVVTPIYKIVSTVSSFAAVLSMFSVHHPLTPGGWRGLVSHVSRPSRSDSDPFFPLASSFTSIIKIRCVR